jgi:flagellar basal body-associated protein FliL
MTTIKIKIELELDEEQVRDIFESYDIKFTKKKFSEIKKSINAGEIDFQYEIEDDINDILGDYIQQEFGE